jgi:hypothetical protein
MRVFKFAAGMAVGYVLGSRAGREKYEQIVAGYQSVTSHPTVVQTQEKAKQLVTSRASTAISKMDPTAPDAQAELPVAAPRQPTRRKTAVTSPDPIVDPIADPLP